MVDIKHKIIQENGPFPNNPDLPLLHYRNVLGEKEPSEIKEVFRANGWRNSWINGLYSYHHFHSNTHEVLGMSSGYCDVEIGGEGGKIFRIEAGDVLVIPAGVSHKNVGSSTDFICVASYPTDTPYDMREGKEKELEEVKHVISEVPLPKKDSVHGSDGPLLDHWTG